MLIGVMSDSHDHLPMLQKAVNRFNQKKADFVIHAGDFVAPFTLKLLEELRCPWIGVFGNNDGEQTGLTRISRGRIQPAPYALNLDGKKVVVVHDLDAPSRKEALEKEAQVIIHGHTHVPLIEKEGSTLLLNPGELCGWLHGRSTLAFLNLATMDASIEDLALEP